MTTYEAFAEYRNKFQEQCIFGQYSLGELPKLRTSFNILDLKYYKEANADLSYLNVKFDEDKTMLQVRKKNPCPIFGALFTTTKTSFTLRKHEEASGREVNTDYGEFDIADKVVLPRTNFAIITPHVGFCQLANHVNTVRERSYNKEAFACLLALGKSGFDAYLGALRRFYPASWITFYIDYYLAHQYLGPQFLDRVVPLVDQLFAACCAGQKRRYGGAASSITYVLQNKHYAEESFTVFVLCPGVLVGYSHGILLHGNVLSELMTIQNKG